MSESSAETNREITTVLQMLSSVEDSVISQWKEAEASFLFLFVSALEIILQPQDEATHKRI